MSGDLSSEKMRALAAEWRKLDLQASMTEAEQARYDKLPELMADALERAADWRAALDCPDYYRPDIQDRDGALINRLTDALSAALDRAEAAASAARDAAFRKAAAIARDGCLAPPDGGSPSDEEREFCEEIARRIIAHIPTPLVFDDLPPAALFQESQP